MSASEKITNRIEERQKDRRAYLRRSRRAQGRRAKALLQRRWSDARSALEVARANRENAQEALDDVRILRRERKQAGILARTFRHRRSAGRAADGRQLYWFDGVRVFDTTYKHLVWARKNGWKGRANSGYREPWYSERLCYAMCGRPSCPGRCAGRNSNHSREAVDVGDYYTFGRLMKQSPHRPKIFNGLGARDPVHFSPSGN